MPFLISLSYRPLRKTPSGEVHFFDPEHAMVATMQPPSAFVLAAREKASALWNGSLPADQWSADDIQALLSVIEISDDEYVKLNDVL